MVKNIFFNDDVTDETVIELMERLDSCMCGIEVQVEKVVLNWSSRGGVYASLVMLSNYINQYPIDIEIVAYDICASAGFIFLLYTDRPVRVLDSAFAIIHLGDMLISSRDGRDSKSYGAFMKKGMDELDVSLLNEYKLCGFSEEEMAELEKGRDVHANKDRLVQLLETYDKSIQISEIDLKIEAIEEELNYLKEVRSECVV